ncbi:MAG: hypothetical protein RIT81_18810 [Deltaproteobacteria bacterium]
MKRLLIVLLFAVASLRCSGPCQTRSDCDDGEFCNFNTGDCVTGCESDGDCSPSTYCDTTKGQCALRNIVRPVPDGGTTTSTAPDAG